MATASETRARLDALVAGFAAEAATPDEDAVGANKAFVSGPLAATARALGPVFWLPPERGYAVFLHAYSALFCIPVLTEEALSRDPERFTVERLPHTVQTTSGFILDAFGYDRRTERYRQELYWPAPAIRAAHAERGAKGRISEAAMAYFGFQLVRAAEALSPRRSAADFAGLKEAHFGYFGEFLRRAGYVFSRDRQRMADFAAAVDAQAAGDACLGLVQNALAVAPALDAALTAEDLLAFLPPRSARLAAGVIGA